MQHFVQLVNFFDANENLASDRALLVFNAYQKALQMHIPTLYSRSSQS